MPNDPVSILGVSEPVFRMGIFLSVFAGFSALEAAIPRRARLQSRLDRWATNGSMLIIATVLVRAIAFFLPVIAATAGAALALQLGWGLFNAIALPFWAEVLLAIALLDLAIWFQHLISHKVPVLWRLHRVHHADRDLDASSALRFHPVEIALSAAYKLAIILLLGPAAIAVVLFEVILNASAMFNHANLALPKWLDTLLRMLFVTPDMHRVHHSIHRHEHDTNYGFCLSIWDRLFRTYTPQPGDGHQGMTLGLEHHQSDETKGLVWSLGFPIK